MCTVEKRNEKEHVFVGDYLSDNYVQRDIAAVSTPESGTTAAPTPSHPSPIPFALQPTLDGLCYHRRLIIREMLLCD
jgi:hypothetical protein